MTRAQIIDLVNLKCPPPLTPALVCAIIEQESDFNPWAFRFEPAFLNAYVLKQGLKDITECEGRATSWGLMQVMGQSARELGYVGSLPQLCDPEIGIFWGCKLFIHKLEAAKGDTRQALLFWNGGGNTHYPDEVLARLGRFSPTEADANKSA